MKDPNSGNVRLMGVGVYDGKDLWKGYVFSLEWRSEWVNDDESGGSERDESEEDWLAQVWRSETGNTFERWGAVYRNEQTVTYKEELAAGCAILKQRHTQLVSQYEQNRFGALEIKKLYLNNIQIRWHAKTHSYSRWKNWTVWYMKRFSLSYVNIRELQTFKTVRFLAHHVYIDIKCCNPYKYNIDLLIYSVF